MTYAASLADELVIFVDQPDSAIDLRSFALDGKVPIVQLSGDVQRGFQQFDVFVKGAKQGFNPASNLYGASHERFGQMFANLLPSQPTDYIPPWFERNHPQQPTRIGWRGQEYV